MRALCFKILAVILLSFYSCKLVHLKLHTLQYCNRSSTGWRSVYHFYIPFQVVDDSCRLLQTAFLLQFPTKLESQRYHNQLVNSGSNTTMFSQQNSGRKEVGEPYRAHLISFKFK